MIDAQPWRWWAGLMVVRGPAVQPDRHGNGL